MKTDTLYRNVLKKAWSNTINNKKIWFFGFFAFPLLISSLQILSYTSQSVSENQYPLGWDSLISVNSAFFFALKEFILNSSGGNFFSIFWLMFLISFYLIFLALIFFMVWLFTVAQGSIVDACNKTDGKKTNLTLLSFINNSTKNTWPLLKINIGLSLILLMISLFISTSFTAAINSALAKTYNAVLTHIFFTVVLVPVAVLVIFTARYAVNYIMIEKLSVRDAINKGLKLFLANWLITLEMGIILLVVTFTALIFTKVMLYNLIYLPFLGLLKFLYPLLINFKFLAYMIIILAFIIMGVISFFVIAMVATFQYSSWVYLFKDLISEKKTTSKLIRIFER